MQRYTESKTNKKNISKLVYQLVLFASLACFIGWAITVFISGYSVSLNNFIAVISVVLSVYLCFVYRYNIGLFLVFLFITYCNYSIAVAVYLDPSIRPQSLYNQFGNNVRTYGIAIACVFIFVLLMLVFSKKIAMTPECIDSRKTFDKDNYDYNPIIAVGGLVLYVIVFFTSFSVNMGERGHISPFGEYRAIILLIGSYYSGRKPLYKIAWTIVTIVTVIPSFLAGNRVDSFASIIGLIICWYYISLNYKKILLILPIIIVLMNLIGMSRGSVINQDINKELNASFFQRKLTLDTAYFAYVPSLAAIELADKIKLSDKLLLLFQHIKYIFTIGSSSFDPGLSLYTRDYYAHAYGFISPSYFYFWFNYIGSLIFGILVQLYNYIYKKYLTVKASTYFQKLGIILSWYFIASVGRWYCYGPMPLLRGEFVCAVAFSIVYFFNVLFGKRKVTA